MNACLFVLCFALGSAAPPKDRWIGEDKWKHFFASFAVTSISAGGARLVGLDADASLAAGVGAGAALGVWKELRDQRRPDSTASVRDLVWDAAGIGAAAAVVAQTR